MIWVAFDVAYFTIAQVDLDAAAASTHVARGSARLRNGISQRWASRVMNRCGGHAAWFSSL
jgi:hypothetical protein